MPPGLAGGPDIRGQARRRFTGSAPVGKSLSAHLLSLPHAPSRAMRRLACYGAPLSGHARATGSTPRDPRRYLNPPMAGLSADSWHWSSASR